VVQANERFPIDKHLEMVMGLLCPFAAGAVSAQITRPARKGPCKVLVPDRHLHELADPSGVATHGEALASAGQSAFRSERVVICFAADPIGSFALRRGASDAPVRASYI
jgi:hypothetical protein